jgi:hypothetical protein
MNINGVQIPTYMVHMITDYMITFIKGGMEANAETLAHAVRCADADVQSICTQMQTVNRDAIRNTIATEVYAELNAKAAA